MGCNSGYPAVSGKVTANGKPVAMVRVIFTPMAVGENHTPGPFSTGVTDQDGKFKLKTRNGETGAVAGPHQVGFEWADIEFDEMSALKDALRAATGERSELEDGLEDDDKTQSAESAQEIQKKIDELIQKKASRPKVNFTLVVDFEIPPDGTDSADFEIGK